ncbi:hypothetical protein GOBAR_DD36909 [Gossypium barbadense]|nr:hypothetical protein GOBAR_DD36909 [Gossypium barbadense]
MPKPMCGALTRRCSTSQPLSGTTAIELCDNLGVDNLCRSSHNNLMISTIVSNHGYRRGNQLMMELENQHMVELDSEDQTLNTSGQWVDAFYDES